MLRRWLSPLAILCVVALPSLARAQDASPPTSVVRVRSLEAVIDNIKMVVALAGKENVAEQIEGLIKTKIGADGLVGIDPKRPFGGYVRLSKDLEVPAGAVMIPIADEKAFLGLLENLTLKVTKDKKGIYSVSLKPAVPVDIAFRFANKYAYVTALNLEALEPGNLVPPEKIFSANMPALSASVRLDQVPNAAKLIAVSVVEQKLEEEQNKRQPGETDKQRELRVQILKKVATQIRDVLEDGSELSVALDVSKKAGAVTADIRLSAMSKSNLAETIQKLGKTPSLFAGLAGADSAAHGLIHFIPAEDIRKALAGVVDEAMDKALASIQDEAKRKQAESLAKALAPTLRAGEIDVAFNLAGPGKNKNYNLIVAGKVKEGNHLGKTVRALVEDLLKSIPPAEAEKIKLDADAVGDIKIHRVEIQSAFDPKARAVFGDNPIYVAFRDDAVFLALGEGALPALKKGLTAKPGEASPLANFEVSLARIAPLLAKTDEQKEIVEKAFKDGEPGTVSVRLQGGADLRLSLSARLSVLQVLAQLLVRDGKFKIGE
ncbi:MAG: hypothetical protein FJ271_01355 [Planctomycetes bacterium]|nr:hypothetical protein [Planctomycetota bacterium]